VGAAIPSCSFTARGLTIRTGSSSSRTLRGPSGYLRTIAEATPLAKDHSGKGRGAKTKRTLPRLWKL